MNESNDKIVEEVHQARAELLKENSKDVSKLVKKLIEIQDSSGKEVIQKLNPSPDHRKAG